LVYIHNGVESPIKKNKIMQFTGKCVELEIITLSEISQTQKRQISHVFSHMWKLDFFLKDMKVGEGLLRKRKGTSVREKRTREDNG
jgi:hypothetical protein